jgi:nucleotide-sensitive chloride channel 1A
MTAQGLTRCDERDANGAPVCDVAGASLPSRGADPRPSTLIDRSIYRSIDRRRRSRSPSPLASPRSHPPLPADDETIATSLPITFHVGDDVVGTVGTLYLTTRRVVFFPDAAGAAGFAAPFTSVTMHAVSRGGGDGGFDRPCIYAQVEGAPPDGVKTGGEETEKEEEEEEEDGGGGGGVGVDDFDEMTELRLVPTDPSALDDVFNTMSECAAMNPDDDDDDDDDGGGGGGGGGFYYDEAAVANGAGAAERAAALARLDALLVTDGDAGDAVDAAIANDPGRFEDDDE